METITITKRLIKGEEVYNKRFDDYDKGFYGPRITKKEYEESKSLNEHLYSDTSSALHVVERITYKN